MEGWCPVEDLVRWGFAHAPVVMANEAHNGLARCIRTREVGVRASKVAHEEWVPMGWHFREMSGVDQFVIDQDVTVNFGGEPRPWVPELLAGWDGVDALVVSTDNEMTA